jgi:hypothetical protein
MRKFLSFLGGITAFVTVVAYALYYINMEFLFLPTNISTIIGYIMQWGALLVLAITGLEFVWIKRVGVVLVVIYLLLVAVVVVFMFFPALAGTLIP